VSVSPSLVANCVDGKPRRRRGSHGGETLAAASGSTSEVPLAGTLRPAGRPPLGRVTLTSMALLTGEDHQGLATALYAQAGLAAQ
jgi:hypothetical protein